MFDTLSEWLNNLFQNYKNLSFESVSIRKSVHNEENKEKCRKRVVRIFTPLNRV